MTNPSEQLARRIACAEILGWKFHDDPGWRLRRITRPNGDVSRPSDPRIYVTSLLPDPETNPADALALLEVMEKKGWSCKLHMVSGTNCWHCALKKKGEKSKYATCETLPLAIVSAVLKAEGKG